jgi:hypothetical protein
MKNAVKATVIAGAMLVAAPSFAQVTRVAASTGQGTLVHGTNTVQTGPDVIGNLGTDGPNIVHFTGLTDAPVNNNFLMLQDGQGQADVTGAEITLTNAPNDAYNILSGDIFLTGHEGFDYIEFAITGLTSGTVDFWIDTTLGGMPISFPNVALGSGNTFFAFDAAVGALITNVHYAIDAPNEIVLLKQVRIDGVSSIPEPSSWALMLFGFGAVGFTMRRRRKNALTFVTQ